MVKPCSNIKKLLASIGTEMQGKSTNEVIWSIVKETSLTKRTRTESFSGELSCSKTARFQKSLLLPNLTLDWSLVALSEMQGVNQN